MNAVNVRAYFWLLLSTVLLPGMFTLSVGVLILVFYREAWDVAFGVLVLCFALAAIVGSLITVFLIRRTARLTQLQSDFVANISHDFRTPLTSIRMFVDTLRAGKVTDPEEKERCLALLAQETERMEALVNRVLTWRTMERGVSGYRLSRHDPARLLEKALGPFRIDPAQAGRLEVDGKSEGMAVMADEIALVEALRNLVENAFRYARDGRVAVTLGGDGQAVEYSVRDRGTPIPPKERRRIFKRFYRAASNTMPGTGLGLAIVRHVAIAHGGSVDVQSSEEEGNTFYLRLPLAPAEAGEPEEAE